MRIWLVVACIIAARDAEAEPCTRAAPGFHGTCTLEHGGRTREYELYVPQSAKPPAPLVVNLHGRKGTGREQESRLIAEADRFGFVLVSPQGYERSWNSGIGLAPARQDGIDDVSFVRAIVKEVQVATSIDAARVYATGLSNGGRMAHRLGCEASDVFAAIASVAGPIADRDEETGERAFHCNPLRAVPVLMIHGTRDTCTPYAGGAGIETRGNVATPVAAREWAQRANCSTTTVTHRLGSTTCEVYSGCAERAEVAMCTVRDAGHVWPGGPRYALWEICGGTWPDDFRASEQIWRFFAAHPRSEGTAWQPASVTPSEQPALQLGPVESVDLPFDRSQISLSFRGTAPGTFDTGGAYRDGSLAASGAISLYSRLRVRQDAITGFRLMAQFRIEGERVTSDMFMSDQQVTKGALGITFAYLSSGLNLYAVYAGAAIAESTDTLKSPTLMPTALGIGTYRQNKSLTWIYGGGFGYALGRPWLLPAGGVSWAISKSWRVTTILPIFVELRYNISRKLATHLLVSVSGDRFNFANQGEFAGAAETLQLQLGQGKLGLGVAYSWSRSWTIRGELGVVGPRKLTIADGDTMVTTANGKGAGYLSTSVTYAFGSSPL